MPDEVKEGHWRIKPQDFPADLTLIRKPVLITGCPRSGTRAIANALTNVGFPIGHERSGPRGISSSFFAVNDWHYQGVHRAPLSRYRFDQVWHQVRDPLKTISSMADRMDDTWWRWQEKFTHIQGDMEPIGIRCALFWLRWSNVIYHTHSKVWRYRLEDIHEVWPEMCERLGIPPCEYQSANDHGHNPNKDDRYQYSWDELKSMNAKVYGHVASLSRRYGYGS